MGAEPRITLIALSAKAEPEGPVEPLPVALADVLIQTRSLYERVRHVKPWVSYVAVEHGKAVGLGAFKSAPENGRVEIAYMTVPSCEGRGVATATARRLIEIARAADPNIDVRAQTLPEKNASTAILNKLGFVFDSEIQHPEDGLVWEWRLAAPEL